MKQTRPERSRRKNDPQFVAKARQLRDVWAEHVSSGRLVLESNGKYDVARALPEPAATEGPIKQLSHAA